MITDAIKTIKKHKPQRVVIEATGRLEMPSYSAFRDSQIAFMSLPIHYVLKDLLKPLVNEPRTTSSLDARITTLCRTSSQPELTIKAKTYALWGLSHEAEPTTTMQTMERNRLQILPKNISSTITPIQTALKKSKPKKSRKDRKSDWELPQYQAKNTILQSMPGVGKILAAS